MNTTPAATAHSVSVTYDRLFRMFEACCGCGWTSPEHDSKRSAMGAGDRHIGGGEDQ